MPVVVQKYGGSSVADVDKLGAVADKIVACRQEGNDVVAVVSAMGKTTDSLLTLAHQVDPDPPRRELDMLLSTGERISMALLSMAVQRRGQDAISFTGSQSGIITNDRHFDARIISVRPHRVEDELARGKVVILAGYQGMSYKREVTTLGRGGSDTTALAMAAALGATRAEIYSDVDGVYSADPQAVVGAEHLPTLSYDEMQEMAVSGAQVLHAQAVEFARSAGIEIHARSTFKPGRETCIAGTGGGPPVCAVVSRERLVQVSFSTRQAGFDAVLARARQDGACIVGPELSDDHGVFLVDLGETPDWGRVQAGFPEEAQQQEGVATLSAVGRGIARGEPPPEALLEALSDAGVTPLRFRASGLAATAVIDASDVSAGLDAAHKRLIEERRGQEGT